MCGNFEMENNDINVLCTKFLSCHAIKENILTPKVSRTS